MISYIKTNKNNSDIMTKQSAGPQFAQHWDYALGIIDVIGARPLLSSHDRDPIARLRRIAAQARGIP
jgi:hypothetical protein